MARLFSLSKPNSHGRTGGSLEDASDFLDRSIWGAGQVGFRTARSFNHKDGRSGCAEFGSGQDTVNFEIADIHPRPRRRYPFFDGGFLVNGRYLMRQATLVDLIATAYGQKDSTYVHGGPSWLEWDRWDVIAKVPPGTTEAAAKEMLQSLLAGSLHSTCRLAAGNSIQRILSNAAS